VITRDAAGQLADCLASAPFAGEIVVVDSGSRDDTVEIARAQLYA
jgi:glycosyltransferase involved in cell wall biosynthesis